MTPSMSVLTTPETTARLVEEYADCPDHLISAIELFTEQGQLCLTSGDTSGAYRYFEEICSHTRALGVLRKRRH